MGSGHPAEAVMTAHRIKAADIPAASGIGMADYRLAVNIRCDLHHPVHSSMIITVTGKTIAQFGLQIHPV